MCPRQGSRHVWPARCRGHVRPIAWRAWNAGRNKLANKHTQHVCAVNNSTIATSQRKICMRLWLACPRPKRMNGIVQSLPFAHHLLPCPCTPGATTTPLARMTTSNPLACRTCPTSMATHNGSSSCDVSRAPVMRRGGRPEASWFLLGSRDRAKGRDTPLRSREASWHLALLEQPTSRAFGPSP